jgi:acyl carrier protein
VLTAFEHELLTAICATCNLKDVNIDTISSDDPLIGPDSSLGIDSLDALEIVVMVQQEYGVRIESENSSRIVLASVATLAAHIDKHAPQNSY